MGVDQRHQYHLVLELEFHPQDYIKIIHLDDHEIDMSNLSS